MVRSVFLLAAMGVVMVSHVGAVSIEVGRRFPCNLFPPGEPVAFEVTLKGFPEGTGVVAASISNYFGEEVFRGELPISVSQGQLVKGRLEPGVLETGYYEMTVWEKSGTAETGKVSFGVFPLIDRSAEQALEDGSRFGIKIFQLGAPGVWWRKGTKWNVAEAVDASAKLGLQWTRHQFNQLAENEPGIISTSDLIGKHPMNVVLKIEGFPEECYDAARYGPLEKWAAGRDAAKKNKNWARCTVPKREPYQKWLKEEIEKLPVSQRVFEIGNEVWDYMTGAEFAEWCAMVAEVVGTARSGAVIAADPGDGAFREEFLEAGGFLRGVNARIAHPYSFTPMPEHRTRMAMRNERDYFRERTGRDLDVYVTEYGWSTAPNDTKRKHGVTERQQAQRTVRQSLMLYAEGCKTLIAHWLADREQDPTEREHWFGFFRLNGQPKPVVMATAACARMIDGGRFVGDIWVEPGVGAMLFEKNGTFRLALWTLDEALGSGRKITIDVDAPEVIVVDMMGRESRRKTIAGNLQLKVNSDVQYVVGVGPGCAKRAVSADQDLNDAVWNTRAFRGAILLAAHAPTINGSLEDWAKADALELKDGQTGGGVRVWLARDASFFYVAAEVRDQSLVSTAPEKGESGGDSLEIALSTKPSRQTDALVRNDPYEFTIRFFPETPGVPTRFQIDNILLDPSVGKDSGVHYAARIMPGGWALEAAIPVGLLRGFPEAGPGAEIAVLPRLHDVDRPGEKARRIHSGSEVPQEWPVFSLEGKQ